ncbi:MAG: hypothetical protein M3R69_05655 [Acidobacteriota bacterium]|nr:hypothetical protein [Acidobacteriota bacterium]
MTRELSELGPGSAVPEAYHAVVVSGREIAPVGRNGDTSRPHWEGPKQLATLDVPAKDFLFERETAVSAGVEDDLDLAPASCATTKNRLKN